MITTRYEARVTPAEASSQRRNSIKGVPPSDCLALSRLRALDKLSMWLCIHWDSWCTWALCVGSLIYNGLCTNINFQSHISCLSQRHIGNPECHIPLTRPNTSSQTFAAVWDFVLHSLNVNSAVLVLLSKGKNASKTKSILVFIQGCRPFI